MKTLFWVLAVSCLSYLAFVFGGENILPPKASEAETSLNTTRVIRRNMAQHVSATGIVNPIIGAEVKVGSRISGTLNKLFVTVGSKVEKGEIIARLDALEWEVNLAKARAQLAEEMANLALLERGARPEKVQSEKHNLQKSKADMDLAEVKLGRAKKLYAQKTLSKQDLDFAVWEWETAVTVYEASRMNLELVETKYTQEDFDLAEAKVAQSQAALKEAEIKLSYTTIRAPISGVVASVSTMEGETVAASQVAPTFVTITNLDRLQVNAYIDETDIGKIKKGQIAKFTVDSYPAKDFSGKVFSISPKGVIQGNVVMYDVQIDINDPDRLLKPDMTASVVFTLKEKKNILAILQYALQREGGKKIVTVLSSDGKSQVDKEVKTGWKQGKFVEITNGINESDTILIKDD